MSGQIYKALASITEEIGAIRKDREMKMGANGRTMYSYRSIDAFYQALNPLLARHRMFIKPQVLDVKSECVSLKDGQCSLHVMVRVAYKFCCEDGSEVECVAMGEGLDSSDKALGKALSYAHKYCLIQMFCVPTEDLPDADAERHEVSWSGGGMERERRQPPVQRATPQGRPARRDARGGEPGRNEPGGETRGGRSPQGADPWHRMMRLLSLRHKGKASAMMAEAGDFLGRDVRSMNDVSQEEAADIVAMLE